MDRLEARRNAAKIAGERKMKPLDKKHSPGPWEAIDYYYKTYVKSESEIVAQLPGCGGKFRANADLISAAPELLECLKEAVLEFGCHTHMLAITHGECNGFIREEWRCTLPEGKCFAQRWLSAIRKAEGLK